MEGAEPQAAIGVLANDVEKESRNSVHGVAEHALDCSAIQRQKLATDRQQALLQSDIVAGNETIARCFLRRDVCLHFIFRSISESRNNYQRRIAETNEGAGSKSRFA